MSSGTDFTANIFLNRMVFSSKYELESRIKDAEDTITNMEKQLAMYAVANPRDLIPSDWNDSPVEWVQSRIEEIMDNYQQEFRNLVNLNHYLETEPKFEKQ